MKNLLISDDLNVVCEEQIFHALMSWINCDPISRRQHIGYLLGFVKLPLLSPIFLTDQVEPAVEGKQKLPLKAFLFIYLFAHICVFI